MSLPNRLQPLGLQAMPGMENGWLPRWLPNVYAHHRGVHAQAQWGVDLLGFLRSVQLELLVLSKRALHMLPTTHTAVDVERSFSFYKLARSEEQLALTNQHHIGHINFAMNGLVPPP